MPKELPVLHSHEMPERGSLLRHLHDFEHRVLGGPMNPYTVQEVGGKRVIDREYTRGHGFQRLPMWSQFTKRLPPGPRDMGPDVAIPAAQVPVGLRRQADPLPEIQLQEGADPAFGAALHAAMKSATSHWLKTPVGGFTVVHEGKPVGIVRLKLPKKRGDFGGLIEIALAPEVQDEGIGKAAVLALMRKYPDVQKFGWTARKDNTASLSLLRSLGGSTRTAKNAKRVQAEVGDKKVLHGVIERQGVVKVAVNWAALRSGMNAMIGKASAGLPGRMLSGATEAMYMGPAASAMGATAPLLGAVSGKATSALGGKLSRAGLRGRVPVEALSPAQLRMQRLGMHAQRAAPTLQGAVESLLKTAALDPVVPDPVGLDLQKLTRQAQPKMRPVQISTLKFIPSPALQAQGRMAMGKVMAGIAKSANTNELALRAAIWSPSASRLEKQASAVMDALHWYFASPEAVAMTGGIV